MDVLINSSIAIWALALAVVAHTIGWFFRSPKEAQETNDRRILMIEGLVSALSLKVEGTHSRHEEALDNCTSAIMRLTDRLDRFLERRQSDFMPHGQQG